MSSILITGAFGFVGINLSKALHSNHHLIAVDLNESDHHLHNQFYSWNDLDQIDWSKIDVIIHLAGKAHDTKNTTEEKVYMDVNVGLTEKIFERFLNSSANKFIYFSSVKAVADTVQGEVLTEKDKPLPGTAYGKSKFEAEKYLIKRLNEWKATLLHEGTLEGSTQDKSLYILRPTMIHGPGNKGNLNLLYNVVCKGIPWPLGAFENLRSSTSISNLQFIIKTIIETNVVDGTYIVSDDQAISTNRIIEIVAESRNKKPRIWKINSQFIKHIASIGDKLHLPLNSERLKKLTESYVVSNQIIKEALKVSNLPVSAEEGMKQTINSFNKNK